MKNIYILFFFALALLITTTPTVLAESWWGKGAKSNEWVLSHGGTIIRYLIIANGSQDRYKAVLYENGKVVEWENGKNGLFDDPKNSTYTVTAFRGGINEQNKTSKGGKKILSSGPIVAHPGETITVTLNDFTNKVTVVSDRRSVAAKKAAPSVLKNKTQSIEKSAPISTPAVEKMKEVCVPLDAVVASIEEENGGVVPIFPDNKQYPPLPLLVDSIPL